MSSIDELAGVFWRPVEADGEPIPDSDGDYWEFSERNGLVDISGYDGCNSFGIDAVPGEVEAMLVDDELTGVSVDSSLQECPDDIDSGPYPADGHSFLLVDDGARLLVQADGATVIELERVEYQPDGAEGAEDGFTPLRSFELLVESYWQPVEQDGEPVPDSLGVFWRLFGYDDTAFLTGFDGCGGFTNLESTEAATRLVDGTLAELTLGGEAIDCGDTLPVRPQQGDSFELSNDGSTLRVVNQGVRRVVLELRSEQPLGDRLTPGEEREFEEQRQAEEAAEAARFEAETQEQLQRLRADLDAARARWDSAGLRDYAVEFDAGCLQCESWPTDPTSRERYSIDVVDGGGSGPWVESTVGASIDEWFVYLAGHLDAGGFAQAEFDADLGHPTLLYVALNGRTGSDEAVGVDEGQLDGVTLTPAGAEAPGASATELIGVTWVPVLDAGRPVAPDPPKRWYFGGSDRAILVEGNDGCNFFSSFVEPNSSPLRLVDGVLTNLEIVGDEAACDIEYGPTPRNGDLLRLVDGGDRLEVVTDGEVRVELVRSS